MPAAIGPLSSALVAELQRGERPEPPRTQGVDVAAVRTRLTPEQAASALDWAYRTRFGEAPRRETLAILTAQWAHETGRGEAMFNYNFGGIKGRGPSGMSVVQRTREGFGADERVVSDRFRAYATAEEGALDYLTLLDTRYGEALDAARSGDPAGFVRGLKARGYFTGHEGRYTASVTALAREMAGLELGTGSAPLPTLDARALFAQAPSGDPFSESSARPPAPYVDPLSMIDALARSALQIAGNGRDRDPA
ncbi:MAG: hypothetical protein DIU78_005625 [Pseudomonadota bacterium]|nr:MAG: hypothetical protein DIU78_03270 [Pseudomonadota bacterium]